LASVVLAEEGHDQGLARLFVFTQHGDCLAATLRPGNVHSADGWDEGLLPAIDRYRAQGRRMIDFALQFTLEDSPTKIIGAFHEDRALAAT
jgi:hypothetical protein